MAMRALGVLPPSTFPAPGVAAAIHRAVTAAVWTHDREAPRSGRRLCSRSMPPGAASFAGRARAWSTVDSSPGRR